MWGADRFRAIAFREAGFGPPLAFQALEMPAGMHDVLVAAVFFGRIVVG